MQVQIIEVGPRDGLQNEKRNIPLETKINFIRNLVKSGIQEIELSSFVSPKWVPQLSDADELINTLYNELKEKDIKFHALLPNRKGLDRALKCNLNRIALFTTTSDEFSKKNMNTTVDETIQEFKEIIPEFRKNVPQGWVRVYLSTSFECPYAGKIDPTKTLEISKRLFDLGIDDLVISDTLGVAVPDEVSRLLEIILTTMVSKQISCHFHDTYGMAIANVARAIKLGITRFDSSAGGLGGCPYAPGASGNLATEDLIYYIHRCGHKNPASLKQVATSSKEILDFLGKPIVCKAQSAYLNSCNTKAA